MSTEISKPDLSLRADPFSQLPPHIAAQYAYLRRTAALAEAIADVILLARDLMRSLTRALIGGHTLAAPRPANSDSKSAPLAAHMPRPAHAANGDAAPRTA